MKILLIYPEMPDVIGRFKYLAELTGRKSSFPPLGLLTIASMMPDSWSLKLIDMNVRELSKGEILWADLVFISAMNVQSKSAEQTIELCKKLGSTVVCGGPLFTHEHEKFPTVDHFILNEAEITLPDFLKDISESEPKRIYKSENFADLKDTPPPMWKLIKPMDYLYSTVQYSRGCPYLCDFCDVTQLFGRVPRTKSAGQITHELDLILSAGKNEMIFFADDNLLSNKRALKRELLPALIKWREKHPYAPAFSTQITINFADDDELCRLLFEAGFRHLLIGIETPNSDSLASMNKKQNLKRSLVKDIIKIQSMGFIVFGTFIIGLDSDREDIHKEIIELIVEGSVIFALINVLKAPPGTALFNRMNAENRIDDSFLFSEEKTNIIPLENSPDFEAVYWKIANEIYSPNSVVKRVISYYNGLNPIKTSHPILRRNSLQDFFRALTILFKLGISFKYRRYVWQLLIWTIKNKPKYFDLSLLFCLTIFQYSKYLEQHENLIHRRNGSN